MSLHCVYNSHLSLANLPTFFLIHTFRGRSSLTQISTGWNMGEEGGTQLFQEGHYVNFRGKHKIRGKGLSGWTWKIQV